MPITTQLNRTLSFPLIICYGVGTIVGGGFYALTGKVAGEAGMRMPVAFLVAALIALFSAFSFAELSARFPFSAGEARYVQEAFGRKWLACAIGWMVIATGVVSAATLADAFAGFTQRFIDVPNWMVISAMVLMLGSVTAWGIRESAWIALVVTIIEVGGLLLILVLSSRHLSGVASRWTELVPSFSWSEWSTVFFGAYLAFYSFIGFEDMVNVAEEVQQPKRNLPRAILLSVVISAGLYVVVALVTVLSTTSQELAASTSPLSLALEDWHGAGRVITIIGMLAGINGALVQIVMSSRVAYGLARRSQAPALFSNVHPWTQTPLEATAAMTLVVLVLALWLPLETLAKITSTTLLLVYAFVNLSLWRIKYSESEPPDDVPCYSIWLPIVGTLSCILFLSIQFLAI